MDKTTKETVAIEEHMRQHKIQQLKLMRSLELNQAPDERYGATLSHWTNEPKAINLDERVLQMLVRYYENKETESVMRETPAGTLIAKPWGDPEFPGIAVFLQYQDKDGKTQERMVSLTEYTSSESVCGYDPMHPESMARETEEVPQQRRNGDSVTPGIITRAWENISDVDSDHKRTIHFVEDSKKSLKDWSKLVNMQNITSGEYDRLCGVTNEDNTLMHWKNALSITDTVYKERVSHRVLRGCDFARSSSYGYVRSWSDICGFRPAFKALAPDADCANLRIGDVVVMGTLRVDSEPLKVPADPVYDGDIINYDKDGSGIIPKITLNTALEDPAYQVKAIYVGDGLFVCDRVVMSYISWEQIHAALAANEKGKDWSALVKVRNITSEEYDRLYEVASNDNTFIHWKNAYSITDTVHDENVSNRVIRGYLSAERLSISHVMSRYSISGWRPAFEALTSTNCESFRVGDVVTMGSLYVDDVPVKVSANPVFDEDVTAYDKSGFGITSKITLGAALDDPAYQVKAIYVGDGLFVCDRVVLSYISWEQIHAALV